MGTTVEKLAREQGRSTEQVIAACKRVGVLAWSAPPGSSGGRLRRPA